MIKVEKKGNTTKATVEGNTYVLVDEFQTVLHALFRKCNPTGSYALNGGRCGAKRKGDEIRHEYEN